MSLSSMLSSSLSRVGVFNKWPKIISLILHYNRVTSKYSTIDSFLSVSTTCGCVVHSAYLTSMIHEVCVGGLVVWCVLG